MIKFVEEKRKITVYDDILEMLLETDSITIDNSWCVCVSREPSLFVPALRRTERTKKKSSILRNHPGFTGYDARVKAV